MGNLGITYMVVTRDHYQFLLESSQTSWAYSGILCATFLKLSYQYLCIHSRDGPKVIFLAVAEAVAVG